MALTQRPTKQPRIVVLGSCPIPFPFPLSTCQHHATVGDALGSRHLLAAPNLVDDDHIGVVVLQGGIEQYGCLHGCTAA